MVQTSVTQNYLHVTLRVMPILAKFILQRY